MVQAPDTVLFEEVQHYRQLPPVMFLAAVSALAGWGLMVWTLFLDRPLGALDVPPALALVIGLSFGVVMPLVALWLRMTTVVYPDRVRVNTGLSGTHTFAYRDVVAVEMRKEGLRADYSNRTVGTEDNTRVAYAINKLQGTQLTMADGRFILIGSLLPEELTTAIDTAWQIATISV